MKLDVCGACSVSTVSEYGEMNTKLLYYWNKAKVSVNHRFHSVFFFSFRIGCLEIFEYLLFPGMCNPPSNTQIITGKILFGVTPRYWLGVSVLELHGSYDPLGTIKPIP